MTFSVSDLRDLRLTLDEWNTLMHGGEVLAESIHVDMLVLAGLAVWKDHPDHPDRDWDLTDAGHTACDLIDQVFDWDAFAFVLDDDKTEPFAKIINLQVPMFV